MKTALLLCPSFNGECVTLLKAFVLCFVQIAGATGQLFLIICKLAKFCTLS